MSWSGDRVCELLTTNHRARDHRDEFVRRSIYVGDEFIQHTMIGALQ
jgi:hypothetical protein